MPATVGESGIVLASVRAREANRGVKWLVLGSVGMHAAIFAGALYAANRQPRRNFEPSSIPVELVTLGRPRDPALLPRKVRPPPAAPRAEAQPVAAPEPAKPPPEAVVLDAKTNKTPKRRNQKKQELSSAARALLEGASDLRLDEALDKLDDAVGSPDGSVYGTTTDPLAAANTYEAKVKALLQRRYQLPMTVPPSQRRFLEAEVVLYIDPRGRVTRFEFLKRHRNQAFMSALEGLLRTIDLPAPPPELAAGYGRDGLAIRFKP